MSLDTRLEALEREVAALGLRLRAVEDDLEMAFDTIDGLETEVQELLRCRGA